MVAQLRGIAGRNEGRVYHIDVGSAKPEESYIEMYFLAVIAFPVGALISLPS